MENITEMLKGILVGSIMEIMNQEESYGYEITRKLNALGFDDVVDGTVYAILVRLEKKGLVNTRKISTEIGPPRKFYTLNENGIRELQVFWGKWDFISEKMHILKEGL